MRSEIDELRRTLFSVSRRFKWEEICSHVRGSGMPSRDEHVVAKPEYYPHSGPCSPFDYQDEAISELTRLWCTAPGASPQRALLSMPTGAGKTFVAVRTLLNLINMGATRIVWLAPQSILIDQALEETKRSWWSAPMRVGLSTTRRIRDVPDLHPHAMLCATTAAAALRDVPAHDPRPDVVVFDECHHIESNEFGTLLSLLSRSSRAVIGLTATPGRSSLSEFAHMSNAFGRRLVVPQCLGTDPVSELTRRGVYSSIKFVQLSPTYELDTELIARRRGTHSASNRSLAASPGRLEAIADCVSGLADSDRCLVFAASLAHAHILDATFRHLGLRSAVVGSDNSDEENRLVVEDFRAGDVQIIVNVRWAAVGIDLPSANVAIISVPIRSSIMFEQIVGRVARGPAVGGTSASRVYDFDQHLVVHKGLQSYARFASLWETH